MSSSLISVLHTEERSIVAELRASRPFQRLEAIRRVLSLYDVQPSVATGFDGPAAPEHERATGEVIHFATTAAPSAVAASAVAAPLADVAAPTVAVAAPAVFAPPGPTSGSLAMQAEPLPTSIPLPSPAPIQASRVEAVAEAAVADVVMRGRPQGMESEASSVVSSVRAALLGIGKA